MFAPEGAMRNVCSSSLATIPWEVSISVVMAAATLSAGHATTRPSRCAEMLYSTPRKMFQGNTRDAMGAAPPAANWWMMDGESVPSDHPWVNPNPPGCDTMVTLTRVTIGRREEQFTTCHPPIMAATGEWAQSLLLWPVAGTAEADRGTMITAHNTRDNATDMMAVRTASYM